MGARRRTLAAGVFLVAIGAAGFGGYLVASHRTSSGHTIRPADSLEVTSTDAPTADPFADCVAGKVALGRILKDGRDEMNKGIARLNDGDKAARANAAAAVAASLTIDRVKAKQLHLPSPLSMEKALLTEGLSKGIDTYEAFASIALSESNAQAGSAFTDYTEAIRLLDEAQTESDGFNCLSVVTP